MNVRLCPRCGSVQVHRSRRRGFYEKTLLRLLRMRPFRCYECGHRFRDQVASRRAREVGLGNEFERDKPQLRRVKQKQKK